jgi:capsular polysaccharide biosynthesis protein
MSNIERVLPRALPRRRRDGTLVVIAGDAQEVAALELDKSHWKHAHRITLVGGTPATLHEELAALTAVHLVVDVRSASGSSQLDAFERCFFHLAPRGVWVALRSSRPVRRQEPLVDLAHQLQGPQPRRRLGRPWRYHLRAVSDVKVTHDLVVIGKRKRHLLRLREDQVPSLLQAREPDLRVTEIARLDAGTLDTTGRMHDYGVEPHVHVPDVLTYPAHVVRRYDGAVQLPKGALAYHRGTVLPESFRWHLGSQLDSPALVSVGDSFARPRYPEPTEKLGGSYYHFLYANPGHFGHLMTEALARLWGWPAAKEADPSLKMLCRRRSRSRGPGLETTLLPAFGVDPDDIVWIDGGVTVESLVGCTPMWHNAPPFYAHPGMSEVWARLRTGLIGSDPVDVAPRIFVTRRGHNRPCSNVEEVEKFFADRGFAVITPEDLSVVDQVRTFAGARVIAGFGGAGMFNLAYADSLETVILLNQSAYHARNERLYAAVLGAELHTFLSKPLHDHPPGRTSYRAHQSAWTFDFDLNAPPLDRVIEGLVQ